MPNRIIRGLQLTKLSLQILRQHKQLLLFPFISTATCLTLVSLLVTPSWYFIGQQWAHRQVLYAKEIEVIILILAILFLCNIVILFCNAALIATTMAYCQQKPIKLSAGFKAANACFPQIIQWTLFNTTIGATLRFLQTRVHRLSILSSTLADMTWSVICYFITPILVMEKTTPLQSIKRSSQLLQATWGHSLVSNVGLGFILFFTQLLMLVPAVIGFYFGGFTVKIIGSTISAILLFLVTIFNSAIHNTLRCVFYYYAKEKNIVPPFDKTLLDHVFRQRHTTKKTS